MASKPLHKTPADYVAQALGPVLIMGMVGSLVFFLVEIGYAGEFKGRLNWTLSWFVLASVLVSRIAIERGSAYARLYGVGLGLATGIMLQQYVGFVLVAWVLLGVIWWCTGKLTWDSTVLDENEKASEEGLLQLAGAPGASRPEGPKTPAPPAKPRVPGAGRQTPLVPPRSVEVQLATHKVLSANRLARPSGQAHASGLWTLYFSAAALPIFGLGATLIRSADSASRTYAFLLLAVYVFCAAALLLATSFLGLRRYLREVGLPMPGPMAFNWVARGLAMIACVMLACVLLPRPHAQYSFPALMSKLDSPRQKASDYALQSGQAAEGPGRGAGRNLPGATPVSKDSSAGPNDPNNSGPSQRSLSGTRSGGEGVGGPPAQTRAPFQPAAPDLPIGAFLKGLIYLVLGIAFVVALVKNWDAICQAWQEMFARKGPKPGGAKTPSAKARPSAPPNPFASFHNPFRGGQASRLSPAELVEYTFRALQAWSAQNGAPSQPEQTPFEFAHDLGLACPAIAGPAGDFVKVYAALAYSGQNLPPDWRAVSETLWDSMGVRLS